VRTYAAGGVSDSCASGAHREERRGPGRPDNDVAGPAAGFVTLRGANQYHGVVGVRRLAADETLRPRRGASAAADRRQLLDHLGTRQELGHRTERLPAKVEVQSREDHAHALAGQSVDEADELRLEELRLVYRHHLRAGLQGGLERRDV